MKKSAVIIIFIFSLIGFADASYLTAEHYKGGEVVCEIGGHMLGDCSSVLSSDYATVGGIPVALAGAVYYLLVFVLLLFFIRKEKRKILVVITALTGIGLIASAWFVYLQIFVLDSICVYCMISSLATTILFFASDTALRKYSSGTHI